MVLVDPRLDSKPFDAGFVQRISIAWRRRSLKLSPLGEVRQACSSAIASALLNIALIVCPVSSQVISSPGIHERPHPSNSSAEGSTGMNLSS